MKICEKSFHEGKMKTERKNTREEVEREKDEGGEACRESGKETETVKVGERRGRGAIKMRKGIIATPHFNA